MEMRELARQEHRDRSPGNAGSGLRQLCGIMRKVVDHEQRRVLRDRTSHDPQRAVISVVPEQEERFAYSPLALVGADVDSR